MTLVRLTSQIVLIYKLFQWRGWGWSFGLRFLFEGYASNEGNMMKMKKTKTKKKWTKEQIQTKTYHYQSNERKSLRNFSSLLCICIKIDSTTRYKLLFYFIFQYLLSFHELGPSSLFCFIYGFVTMVSLRNIFWSLSVWRIHY